MNFTNFNFVAVIALAILWSVFTIILFNKFKSNDSIVNVINSRLSTIETFPKYADFYSSDSNALTSNVKYAIKWHNAQIANDSNFLVSGIGSVSQSNAVVVPVDGVYQVTTTIQLSSTNAANDCYAFYQVGSNSDAFVPGSKRHLDFAADGIKVAEIGISQIISLTTTDKLSAWVQVNNSNANMYNGSDMPSARISIVRLS